MNDMLREFTSYGQFLIPLLTVKHDIEPERVQWGDKYQYFLHYTAPERKMQDTVVIYLHGGGWNSNEAKTFHYIGQFFAKSGYDCVLLNYRKVPKVHYEEIISDTFQGYCEVRKYFSQKHNPRYILIGYNDGKLFSGMNSRSAKILRSSMIAPFSITMRKERMDRYLHLIEVLIHVAEGGPDYYFQDDIISGAAEMMCGGLARLVVERTEQRTRIPRELAITQDFIRLVQAACLEHRDLDYYARELCITPKYLSRIVSKVSGKKALQLIQESVIAEAETLLKDGSYSVQQVSGLLRFPSPSYFCRYFRKATGQTPRAYMLGE